MLWRLGEREFPFESNRRKRRQWFSEPMSRSGSTLETHKRPAQASQAAIWVFRKPFRFSELHLVQSDQAISLAGKRAEPPSIRSHNKVEAAKPTAGNTTTRIQNILELLSAGFCCCCCDNKRLYVGYVGRCAALCRVCLPTRMIAFLCELTL